MSNEDIKQLLVTGKKGGGDDKPDPPVEEPNTLQSKSIARFVDLLCEGEISGPANDNNWYKSTYFNEIPVRDSGGDNNFSGVSIIARKGTSTQSYLRGFDSVESTTGRQESLEFGSPRTITINDSEVDDLRITVSLPRGLLVMEDDGDVRKTTATFKITVTPDGGSETDVVTKYIKGKTTSEYRKQVEIEDIADYGSFPLTFKVYRLTPDSGSAKLVNTTELYSYTTIKNVRMQYPDRAVVGIRLNAKEFGDSLPYRAYKVKGRKIKIPNNYDPDTRTYTGIWNGKFTTAYSNNPAWVVYDMLTNERFGLGMVGNQVDKWKLYSIGQYCDQNVTVTTKVKQSDGSYTSSDSTEPRFTFNGVVPNREEALAVINHLTSVFRGFPMWSTGQVSFVQDKPTSVSRVASLANVSDGLFEYEGTPKTVRHTAAKISFNDPDNFSKAETVILEDEQGIIDYGYNELDVFCFGCNSRSEAIRRGKYILWTELNQTDMVKFRGGMEWADALPGEVIGVQDPDYSNEILSGRVFENSTVSEILIDRDIEIEAGVTYNLTVQQTANNVVERELNNAAGTTRRLTFSTALSAAPQADSVWIISTSEVATREFMILRKTETDIGEYEITGLLYNESKYSEVEEGIVIESLPTIGLPVGELDPPSALEIQPYTYLEGDQGIRKYGVVLSWVPSPDPRSDRYQLRYTFNDGPWNEIGRTSQVSFDWEDVRSGTYDFGVRAMGLTGNSKWVTLNNQVINQAVSGAEPPTGLQVKGGGTQFDGPDCEIEWTPSVGSVFPSGAGITGSVDSATVGNSTVWGYKLTVKTSPYGAGDVRRTTLIQGVSASEFIYTLAMNQEDGGGTPIRNPQFTLQTVDFFDNLSEFSDPLIATNPAPVMSGTPTLTSMYNSLKIDWTGNAPVDNDMKSFKVLLDTNADPTTEIAEVSKDTLYWFEYNLTPNTTYRCKIVPYDEFGIGTATSVASDEPAYLPADTIEGELSARLTYTDSLSSPSGTIAELYDNVTGSGGIAYTNGDWINVSFPTEQLIDRISLWANGQINCYLATKAYDEDWRWFGGTAAPTHNLTAQGRLTEYASQALASTNYWTANAGDGNINIALLPNGLNFQQAKLYIRNGATVYEFRVTDQVIAEWIVANELSAITADLGSITAGNINMTGTPGSHIRSGMTNYATGAGFWLGNDGGTHKFSIGKYNTALPEDRRYLQWDGSDLTIKGIVSLEAGSEGIDNFADAEYEALIGKINNAVTTIDGPRITTGSIQAEQIAANAITAGIRSVGKTSYGDATAGFWLGYQSGAYLFDLGNSSRYLRWTGTALDIKGNITNTGGQINASYITTGNMSANRITTGTLDANQVTINNLNASKITVGLISADRILGGTVTATVNKLTTGSTSWFTTSWTLLQSLSYQAKASSGGVVVVRGGSVFNPYGLSSGKFAMQLREGGTVRAVGNGEFNKSVSTLTEVGATAFYSRSVSFNQVVTFYLYAKSDSGAMTAKNRYITLTEYKK
jgi:hypothetical protein